MQISQACTTLANPIPITELNRILLRQSNYVLGEWLPEGHLSGKEYKARNPLREDKGIGSFLINSESGVWSDFATGDKGGNLVELYGYIKGISDQQQLISELDTFCFQHALTTRKMIASTSLVQVKKKPPTEVIPAEDMFLLPPDSDMAGNLVTGTWEYRTVLNDVLFYVLRTEPEPGKKETKPCRLSGGQWVWRYPEGKLPLYNCHLVNDGSVILFGEGEKTATHLDSLGVGIGMSSAGGSSRLMGSDLSPLKKASQVTIFPDADEPGVKYASQVMWYCLAHDIDCQLLNTDALGWANGEDTADHPELTWANYMPHLISTEDWRNVHLEISDEALFEVTGNLSQVEYDRVVERLAKLSGLSKTTLKSTRKTYLKKTQAGYEDNEPEVDISDIDLPAEVKLARRAELEPVLAELTHSSEILNKVVQICHQLLCVHNEVTLIKLCFLCIVSRLLDGYGDRPVSLMIKGTSSSGKTHVIKQVLKLFRQNASWIILSSISPKGLIYDQRSYRGKVLFLPECNQLVDQDSLLTQLVKTILTEGSITHLTVDTGDSRSPEGKVITKQGPIALIIGTTKDKLDHELETRALSYYVDETAEQTRNIVLQAATRFSNIKSQDDVVIDAALTVWLAFDEWLALSPVRKVSIPFYTKVVEPIAHMPVRYRRDLVEMVPALIKASALIHQSSRSVVDGVIQATPEDYEHVRPMVNEFLTCVQGDSATPSMVRLLTAIYELMSPQVREGKEALSISQPELARKLGITQQAITYQLSKLIEKGYLVNTQFMPKRPAKLKLGTEFNLQAITQQVSILLAAEALEL